MTVTEIITTPTPTPTYTVPVLPGVTPVVTEVIVISGGAVNQVVWDGERLAMATSAGVHLYQAGSLEKIGILDIGAAIKSLAINPRESMLAAGGLDATIQWWNPENEQFMGTFRGHLLGVNSLAVDTSGKILASGSDDGTVRLWDISSSPVPGPSTDRLLRMFDEPASRVTSVAFQPGNPILVASSYQKVYIWDTTSGEHLHTLEKYAGWVNALAFSPDGQVLVSGDYQGELRFWDANNWEYLDRILNSDSVEILSLAYRPDGRLLASGYTDGSIRLWDANTREQLLVLTNHIGAISSLDFNSAGNILVSGSLDGTIHMWGFGSPSP
jgi:WD40 repeat protein